MSRYIVIISVIFFGLLGWQTTVFSQTPIPDIKANGSDGPITLNQSGTLTVTVALDNNGRTDDADWWLAADTPFGIYFFTFDGWTTDWLPGYQSPLFYLDSFEVVNIPVSELPEGTYTLYFGIDTVMDGNVTWDSVYYDTMVLNVVAGGVTGNISAQEVGDAIYRHLLLFGISEAHAGLYYRYTGGDPRDPENHKIIHVVGIGDTVVEETLHDFTEGRTSAYYGAYTANPNGKLSYETRQDILRTALELKGIPYVSVSEFLNTLIPDWSDDFWSGEVNDIARIRCDGVVEYSYEKNGIQVWARDSNKWNISEPVTYAEYEQGTPFFPETQCALWQHNDQNLPIEADELTPNMQRGVKGTQYTNMRPSQPENPTKVSNLDATTHYENGYPIDPECRKIAIKWEDATDDQSGIWGYYIRVDSNEISIPNHNDYVKEKVDMKKPLFEDLEDYKPEWESDDLPDGMYYVHIRSIDNAGNWGDDSPDNPCTAHLGPLCIGECQNELPQVLGYCGSAEYEGEDPPDWQSLYNEALASQSWKSYYPDLPRLGPPIGYFTSCYSTPGEPIDPYSEMYHAAITVITELRYVWDYNFLKEKGPKVTIGVWGIGHADNVTLEPLPKKYELEFDSNMKIESINSIPLLFPPSPCSSYIDPYEIIVDISDLTDNGVLDVRVTGGVEFVVPCVPCCPPELTGYNTSHWLLLSSSVK